VSTATPKWASDGNEPESSEATTVGAQSGDGSEPESSEATTVAAQSGDGNEPQSSDTITRGATAVSNEIKSSPSQSSMAVHNHTSIDDGLPEVLFSHISREYQNLGLNLTQCVSGILSTMCAYGAWACSIEVHASR
jgi:hypothetical protein